MESIRPFFHEYQSAGEGNILGVAPSDQDDVSEVAEPTRQQLLDATIELFAHTSAIPVRNRLRYLIGDEDDPARRKYRFIELDEMMSSLGIDSDTFNDLVIDLDIPTDMIVADGAGTVFIAADLSIVIAEELEWRRKYDGLPDELSTPAIAKTLGIGWRLAHNILQSSNIAPRRDSRTRGSATHANYYPKPLLHRVRAEVMLFPPARQNKTLTEIMGKVGCREPWAYRHMDHTILPDLMRSTGSAVLEHYPPEFEQHLLAEREKHPEFSSSLRSLKQIARAIGRKDSWVRTRLVRFHQQRHLRVKHGRELAFYDEDVYEALRLESERQRAIPELAGGEETLVELIKPLSISFETAERVLRQMGVQPF